MSQELRIGPSGPLAPPLPVASAPPFIDTFTGPGSVVPGDGTEVVIMGPTVYSGNTTRQLIDYVAYGVVGGAAPGPGPAQLELIAYIDGVPRTVNAGWGYWVSPPAPVPPGLVAVLVGAALRTLAIGPGTRSIELRARYFDPGGALAFWEVHERSILIQDIGT
jgi:hypothetical protein